MGTFWIAESTVHALLDSRIDSSAALVAATRQRSSGIAVVSGLGVLTKFGDGARGRRNGRTGVKLLCVETVNH